MTLHEGKILSEEGWVLLAKSKGLSEVAGFYAWTIAQGTAEKEGKAFLTWLIRAGVRRW